MSCECNKACNCACGTSGFTGVMLLNGTGGVYSPWFECHGDNVRAVLEVIALSSTQQLSVGLFTKDAEDTGDGTVVDATVRIDASAAGRRIQEWGSLTGIGLKELVRYRFFPFGGSGSSSVLFRMLSPVWFDTIRSIGSGIPVAGGPA